MSKLSALPRLHRSMSTTSDISAMLAAANVDEHRLERPLAGIFALSNMLMRRSRDSSFIVQAVVTYRVTRSFTTVDPLEFGVCYAEF